MAFSQLHFRFSRSRYFFPTNRENGMVSTSHYTNISRKTSTQFSCGLFYQHRSTLIPAWISNYIHYNTVGWNYLSIPKLQLLHCWSLVKNKQFHLTLYNKCDHLHMLRLTLTHWGRVTHICVGKSTIIGSHNGLSPHRRQAIIWTNAGIFLIRPVGKKSVKS